MPINNLFDHLGKFAEDSLALWDLPVGAKTRLINVSENMTYLVECPNGFRAILRIHRNAYHTYREIESELAWIAALRHEQVVLTPDHYLGRDGNPIQTRCVPGLRVPRHMVLFQFVEGDAPDESGALTQNFEKLGAIAAQCHTHVRGWRKPDKFERMTWDVDAVFGSNPTWGHWRHAPGMTSRLARILEQVQGTIINRLERFGKSENRFNLIHADMRLANLLIDGNRTHLIDFDDCGWGWFMYDFAAAISFIEDDPRIPDLKAAWLRGYRTIRRISDAQEAEIDTFVMLRRMALLAWIGSHIEAPEPQQRAPDFAANSARLGQAYLDNFAHS